jgi:hypothetical protein
LFFLDILANFYRTMSICFARRYSLRFEVLGGYILGRSSSACNADLSKLSCVFAFWCLQQSPPHGPMLSPPSKDRREGLRILLKTSARGGGDFAVKRAQKGHGALKIKTFTPWRNALIGLKFSVKSTYSISFSTKRVFSTQPVR